MYVKEIDRTGVVQMAGCRGSSQKFRSAHASDGLRTHWEWASYRGALDRQEQGGRGWMVKTSLGASDEFVPFAFEVGGALGREAEV